MAIINTALTTIPSDIYVSSGNTVVSAMYFCNTDSGAINFNLYAIPSGVTTANANVQIYNSVQVASLDTFVVDWEKLALGNGDRLVANITFGQANLAITATVSYVGI